MIERETECGGFIRRPFLIAARRRARKLYNAVLLERHHPALSARLLKALDEAEKRVDHYDRHGKLTKRMIASDEAEAVFAKGLD